MDEFAIEVMTAKDVERMAARLQAAPPGAVEHLETRALEYWDKPGLDRRAAAPLFLRLATALALCKDYGRASRLSTMVADEAMDSGDKEALISALGTLGVVLMDSRMTGEARRVFDKLLILSEQAGDAWSRARALHDLGVLEALEGRDIRAVGWFEEALALARSCGDHETARLSERFLDLAGEAPAPASPSAEPRRTKPCLDCLGKGMVQKEDYGMVLCPTCLGARRI